MITRDTLRFLTDLDRHNNRPWFHANRERYEAARGEVVALVDTVLAGIGHFEPTFLEIDPADCLFRINRDTRFARDKAPYKTNFGAFMTDRGRRVARAGFYVHVEPGECLIAAGLYMPPAQELRAVRRALLEDASGLRRILARPAFRKLYGAELPGARLKSVPRGVPRDHPDADLLRYTSFEVYRMIPDRAACSAAFARDAVAGFRAARDFVHWLNAALDRPA
jgi:uncharacterized protein (TIGR02453 family)